MHKFVVAVLLAALSNIAAADVVYQIDLAYPANRIVSFEVAARGSDRFHAMPIRAQDSNGSVTVAITKGQGNCVRDLRIGFADGRRVAISMCASSRMFMSATICCLQRNRSASDCTGIV